MKRYIAGRTNQDGTVTWFECSAFRAKNKTSGLRAFNNTYKGFNCDVIKEVNKK